MKKIKLPDGVKIEEQLKRRLRTVSKNIGYRELTKDEITKILHPLSKYIYAMAKEIKYKDKEKLDDLVFKSETYIETWHENLLKLRNSEEYQKLTSRQRKIKEISKIGVSARLISGSMYANFLKYIVREQTDYYYWQTSQDSRVRESHAELDGRLMSFKRSEFVPQEEPNCRCEAVVVYPKNETERKLLKEQLESYNVKHKTDRVKG